MIKLIPLLLIGSISLMGCSNIKSEFIFCPTPSITRPVLEAEVDKRSYLLNLSRLNNWGSQWRAAYLECTQENGQL